MNLFTYRQHFTHLLLTALMLLIVTPLYAARPVLPLKGFIEQASRHDTMFESILIDALPLQYRRTLFLPDSDVIMDIKYKHFFYLDQDRNDPEASLSLSKLFPYNGTELSLAYNKDSSSNPAIDNSNLQFMISQPIARNAFGKAIRLQDKIIGLENNVSRYQIIEAYEDYLASLTTAYYNWYAAYENLKVGEASYQANRKLMANILDRQRQNIALPIDVNKMKLLLIGKQENIVILREIHDSYRNLVFKAIGNTNVNYIPEKPAQPVSKVVFEKDYLAFTQHSRTYQVLKLLEQQSTLQVEKAADDLLPSTNLLLGYQLDGQDWGLRNSEDTFFAGIQLNWSLGKSVAKARKQVAQVEHHKTILSNQNKYEELRVNLQNLYQQIQRENSLIDMAKKKIRLAESILRDEAENYSFGKVTLNDYIVAVNRVDENRFSLTSHRVNLNKLMIEWLRLTDRLVSNEQVLPEQPGNPVNNESGQ